MEVIDVRELRPRTIERRTFPLGETLLLIPIGDTHTGAPGFVEKRLERTIEWGVQHDALFIGLGDYIDFMSGGNRQRAVSAGFHDSAALVMDEGALALTERFYDIVKPSKGRWVGLLQGHHYWVLSSGGTSDMKLCEWLAAPFLGTCAMVHFYFQDEQRASRTCRVWAHHGTGGGVTQGAILNKLERIMAWVPDADVLMMGHQHRMASAVVDRLHTTASIHPRLIDRPTALVATGSYMTGYTQGSTFGGRPQGSYVEKGIMTPAALGSPIIYMRAVKGHDDVGLELGVHSGDLPC